LTVLCKFDGNLFCFFLPTRKKEERNPTHIAHIGKAPQANAETKVLPKSAILSTHLIGCGNFYYFCQYLTKQIKKM